MQILEHIPDNLKIAASAGAPVLTVFGFPVETWGYILSAVVSIMFIIEKLPIFMERCRTFYNWIKTKYGNSSE